MDGRREVEHRVHEGADLAGLLAGLWGIRQRAVAEGRWPGAESAGAGEREAHNIGPDHLSGHRSPVAAGVAE